MRLINHGFVLVHGCCGYQVGLVKAKPCFRFFFPKSSSPWQSNHTAQYFWSTSVTIKTTVEILLSPFLEGSSTSSWSRVQVYTSTSWLNFGIREKNCYHHFHHSGIYSVICLKILISKPYTVSSMASMSVMEIRWNGFCIG